MNNKFTLLSEITANKSPRFASFEYCAKGTGEVARHTVRLGASVEAAYAKDIRTLEKELYSMQVALNDGHAWKGVSLSVAILACEEMIASLKESIEKGVGNNSAYTCADTYTTLAKGVKAHKESGEIYVSGFSRQKKVITQGVYKSVKSSEKTLAKKKLQNLLLSGKFRQFALPATISAKLNGKELVFE